MTTIRTIAICAIYLVSLTATFASTSGDSVSRFRHGRMLFQTNCAHCHGVHKEILGPMLGSITHKKDKPWLIRFIKDSQKVIASGDSYANVLAAHYNNAVMPCFNQFSDEMIENILLYIQNESLRQTEKITINAEDYDAYIGPDILRGRQLFENQCASCHSITKEGYGPSLGSVTKRHPERWLIDFIHDSQKVINSGDSYATHLFKQFDNRVMVSMEFLTDEEVKDILRYIEFTSSSPAFMSGVNGLKIPAQAHAGFDQPVKATSSTDEKRVFKILFIVITSVASIIFFYVITRFYQFLNSGTRQ